MKHVLSITLSLVLLLLTPFSLANGCCVLDGSDHATHSTHEHCTDAMGHCCHDHDKPESIQITLMDCQCDHVASHGLLSLSDVTIINPPLVSNDSCFLSSFTCRYPNAIYRPPIV